MNRVQHKHKYYRVKRSPSLFCTSSGMSGPPSRCNACGLPAKSHCSSCLSVVYCSPACQRLDWKSHKGCCKETAAAHIEKALRSAEAGDAAAQCDIGTRYHLGWGFAKDADAALRWYRRSAESGFLKAALNLGVALMESSDTAPEAISWLLRAAEGDQAAAFHALGVCYANGTGVKADQTRAAEYFLRAATAGHDVAQHALGECYELGKGVQKSDSKAVMWYQRAADAGNADSQGEMGLRCMEGRGVPRDPAKAQAFWLAAAEGGDSGSQFNLGLFAMRSGAPDAADKALSWFRRAAKKSHPAALFNIGVFYREGRGVAKDPVQAATFFRSAAEAGHVDAMFNFAMCALLGEGVKKSDQEFKEWLRRAQLGSLAEGTGLWRATWPRVPGIVEDSPPA